MRKLLAIVTARSIFTLLAFISLVNASLADDSGPALPSIARSYPWKKDVVTTYFWIGQGASGYNDTTNYASAWDGKWTQSYGGVDDPSSRSGFVPTKFAATRNPFYVALPFNDVAYPDLAKKYVPWYKTPPRGLRYVSQCKGRWIAIRNKDGKVCYAQWEDVGPFRSDHAKYVFGNDRPTTFNKAGLDVSPAVRDFLGLSGLDLTDWKFVEEGTEIPDGPWIKYNEQAALFTSIKQSEMEAARKFKSESTKTALVD